MNVQASMQELAYRGRLVLVVGPSGSGKSELLKALHAAHPEYIYPVSATTRPPRPGEVSGQKYYFLSDDDFDKGIADGSFLEWAPFGGYRYATMRSEIIPALKEGKSVVREVEMQGAKSIMKCIPATNLKIVFINGGSWDVLEKRITARAPMPAHELAKRKERFEEEMTFSSSAHVVVVNEEGKLDETKKHFIKEVEGLITAIA